MSKKVLVALLATATIAALTIPALATSENSGIAAETAQTATVTTETAQAEAAAEPVQAAATFTAENGVLSIELPNANWHEISDPTKWIALSDGSSVITVEHFANGENLPDMTIADDHFVNVYQATFSTQNEVFIITGSVADAQVIPEICRSIMSAKVLKYDTKTAVRKEEPKAAGFTVAAMEGKYYVACDSLNVRKGCSTDEEVIGSYDRGAEVKVTGKAQRDGQDLGWFQIDYYGSKGYVSAQLLTQNKPEQKAAAAVQYTGYTRTVFDNNGNEVTISEATDGFWYDRAGHKFTKVGEIDFVSDNGTAYCQIRPENMPVEIPEEATHGDGEYGLIDGNDNIYYDFEG